MKACSVLVCCLVLRSFAGLAGNCESFLATKVAPRLAQKMSGNPYGNSDDQFIAQKVFITETNTLIQLTPHLQKYTPRSFLLKNDWALSIWRPGTDTPIACHFEEGGDITECSRLGMYYLNKWIEDAEMVYLYKEVDSLEAQYWKTADLRSLEKMYQKYGDREHHFSNFLLERPRVTAAHKKLIKFALRKDQFVTWYSLGLLDIHIRPKQDNGKMIFPFEASIQSRIWYLLCQRSAEI